MSRRRSPLLNARLFALAALLSANLSHAALLSGSFVNMAAGSNVNLTAIGPIDWVHWGLYTETSQDRKDGVVPQISDFTLLDASNGFAYVYQYSDNLNGFSWSDGTPNSVINDTTTGVWAYGVPALESGFEISVPAGTNARILHVFVGVFSAQGRFEATLSDGSAAPYVDTSLMSIRGAANRVYSIQFAANSPGQTLSIRWNLIGTRAADANVTLQAAALTAAGANNPPIVMLTNLVNYASFPAPADITLKAKASDVDGSVTKVEFFQENAKIGEDTISPYSVTWNNVTKGSYAVHAMATDDGGETSDSQFVEIYVYGTGGSLTGSHAIPPTAVNLTSEGTADWAHWGTSTNSNFDHKAGVAQKISDATPLGNHPVARYTDNRTGFSWSDGTPTPSAVGTTTGVYIAGLTNGFVLTAPADTVPRRLKVYVGCYGAEATFQAILTDLSAAPYSDRSLSNFFGSSYVVYTLDYTAASAGQALVVSIRSSKVFDQDFGNVTLQAATLEGGPADAAPVTIINPALFGSSFAFSFDTRIGFNYAVLYSDSLSTINWKQLTVVPGTGGTVSVTNANVSGFQRFYQVQTQ
jgi:hypothetical protein